MKTKKLITLAIVVTLLLTMISCQDTTNEINQSQNDIVTNDENETTTAEESMILEAMNDENYVIVDTRLNDSYNGWNLDGKPGHIEGAVDFSYNWLTADEELLTETLDNKGITAEKNIILCDTDSAHAAKVQAYLEKKGYQSVSVFDLNQWTGALVQYENYELIVPAQIVKSIIDGEKPESFESASKIKIVEASWGEAKNSYDKGHIPTAFHINTDAVEPPPEWMLASDDILLEFLLSHGFESTDTVIVTGEEQMAAYRVAVVLRYLGVSDVRVLNGGTKAWTDAGYDLETDSHAVLAVESFGADIPANPDMIETIDEVQVSLQDSSFTLVDNRTWEEHIGESSGYSYHDKKGRIPGSVFGYAGFENAYSMSYFRNPDNTMRRPEEFTSLWEANGIDLNNRLAFMCGSGWRAAEILYYADVYGLDSITLYSDGWIGWSNKGLPSETGE
ncbi:MAG: thiosulfate sulfurtransferase [Clostridiales bacterium]|nr:thiosulfate sulfurtransferase [Clostridiales bacterium]